MLCLIVNVFEINLISTEYLRLWFRYNKAETYLSFDNLCKGYHLKQTSILQRYFIIYSIQYANFYYIYR